WSASSRCSRPLRRSTAPIPRRAAPAEPAPWRSTPGSTGWDCLSTGSAAASTSMAAMYSSWCSPSAVSSPTSRWRSSNFSVAVAVMQPVGAGRIYVIGSPHPLSNEGLQPRLGDSWGLVLAVLERARGGRIAFDEVHHGETGASGAAGAIAWPVWLGGALAGLVALGYLTLSGRRLGRPLPAGDATAVPSATALV